jgi:hypothetical protein
MKKTASEGNPEDETKTSKKIAPASAHGIVKETKKQDPPRHVTA